jgi:hypothetical protein
MSTTTWDLLAIGEVDGSAVLITGADSGKHDARLATAQRHAPRALRLAYTAPAKGALAPSVRRSLTPLHGHWVDMPGADIPAVIEAVLVDLEAAHGHIPSHGAFVRGCRHPLCRAERNDYMRRYRRERQPGTTRMDAKADSRTDELLARVNSYLAGEDGAE